MSTPRLDRFAATGTDALPASIHLADGKRITVRTGPGVSCLPCPGVSGIHGRPRDYAGPFTHLEVYLDEGVEPGDSDGWELEDSWELLLTAGDQPAKGRLFNEVPVEDIRALIEEHGGEHAQQDA
ncbi:hypothetical protein ABTX60_06935 [Streptomyces sp. NPDC126510]|uniref:hypothetical protein n=1 Tax=Streptomyces sp. NPDC126510 TaxID=3155317 RepID=UPI00331EF483